MWRDYSADNPNCLVNSTGEGFPIRLHGDGIVNQIRKKKLITQWSIYIDSSQSPTGP